MNYENYTVEDFVFDDHFCKWVREEKPEAKAFWLTWLAQHPDKQAIVNEAKLLVLSLKMQEPALPSQEIAQARTQILAEIHQKKNKNQVGITRHFVVPSVYWKRMAAVLVIGLAGILSWLYFAQNQPDIIYTTRFGERKVIKLPDGSSVMLNGNSQLSLFSDWEEQNLREVWLAGEGFFKVLKKPENVRFVVHTENVAVEVLGTSFNVNERNTQTRVVLNEGKIKLSSNLDNQQVEMFPGEMVAFTPGKPQLTKQKVRAENLVAWTQRKLIFDDTPLTEVVQILEQTYGLEVKIKSKTLGNRRLTGEIDVKNADELLDALSKVFNIKVRKQDSKVELEVNN
jgi:transmembrane sensor